MTDDNKADKLCKFIGLEDPGDPELRSIAHQYLSRISNISFKDLSHEQYQIQKLAENDLHLLQTSSLAHLDDLLKAYQDFADDRLLEKQRLRPTVQKVKNVIERGKLDQLKPNNLSNLEIQRKHILLVHKHKDLLEDLLQSPKLLKSHIDEKNFREAISLIESILILHSKLPNVLFVEKIVDEIRDLSTKMLSGMIEALEAPLKLAETFEIIEFLKTFCGCTEATLCRIYLDAKRRALFKARESSEIILRSGADRRKALNSFIDVFRDRIISSVQIYDKIFLTNSTTNIENHGILQNKSLVEKLGGQILYAGAKSDITNSELKSLFTTTVTKEFLDFMEHNCVHLQDEFQRSLIRTQLNYCCNALARVGMNTSYLVLCKLHKVL